MAYRSAALVDYQIEEARPTPYPYDKAGDSNGNHSKESLASVTPRVIQLSQQVAAYSHKIECSFGISQPLAGETQVPPAASNLMSQLQEVERALRSAAYALENALQHING
jgi:hypothetical protein